MRDDRSPEAGPAAPPGPGALPAAPLPDLFQENGTERGMVKRVALLLAAAACFVVGVALWLTPVVTGVPFYLLSALCLALASRRAARWLNARERRLPLRVRLLLRPRLRKQHPGG